MQLLNTLIVIISLALVQYLYRKWVESCVFRAAALKHGCQKPPRYPHKWPYGIDLLQERLAAIKAGRYNRLYLEQLQTYGNTWEENLAGMRVISTWKQRISSRSLRCPFKTTESHR